LSLINFYSGHPLEGYRRLAFMMLDAEVVAVSPSSVYRTPRDAELMKAHNNKPSLNGKGFQQPLRVHEHWHVDISCINVAGTFFYLCSLLDGCSRFIFPGGIAAGPLGREPSGAHPAAPLGRVTAEGRATEGTARAASSGSAAQELKLTETYGRPRGHICGIDGPVHRAVRRAGRRPGLGPWCAYCGPGSVVAPDISRNAFLGQSEYASTRLDVMVKAMARCRSA
jgi:hypothetical protein